MNTDALIELISKKVLEQLTMAAAPVAVTQPVRKESVLVIGEKVDREALTQALGQGFEISLLADVLEPSAENFDHIVLADLPNKLLGDMAMGLERGRDGCVIVESLMLGKTVHILEEGIVYRRFKETAKPAFYQLFEQKEQALVSYGMIVVACTDLARVLKGEVVAPAATVPAARTTPAVVATTSALEPVKSVRTDAMEITHKRVISERDLSRAHEDGYTRFAVTQQALLTPLAKDFVRLNELQVDRISAA